MNLLESYQKKPSARLADGFLFYSCDIKLLISCHCRLARVLQRFEQNFRFLPRPIVRRNRRGQTGHFLVASLNSCRSDSGALKPSTRHIFKSYFVLAGRAGGNSRTTRWPIDCRCVRYCSAIMVICDTFIVPPLIPVLL